VVVTLASSRLPPAPSAEIASPRPQADPDVLTATSVTAM
jgi:hypothetical protein